MDLAIQSMHSAFSQLAAGKAKMPQRVHLEIPEVSDTLLVMPSYLSDDLQIGVKVITLCPENRKQNLPLIQAMVLLLDASTGQTLAILEGSCLTAIRSGAGVP